MPRVSTREGRRSGAGPCTEFGRGFLGEVEDFAQGPSFVEKGVQESAASQLLRGVCAAAGEPRGVHPHRAGEIGVGDEFEDEVDECIHVADG